jgi:hypothetical protein
MFSKLSINLMGLGPVGTRKDGIGYTLMAVGRFKVYDKLFSNVA